MLSLYCFWSLWIGLGLGLGIGDLLWLFFKGENEAALEVEPPLVNQRVGVLPSEGEVEAVDVDELVELEIVGKKDVGGLEVRAGEGGDNVDVLVGEWVVFLEQSTKECIFLKEDIFGK